MEGEGTERQTDKLLFLYGRRPLNQTTKLEFCEYVQGTYLLQEHFKVRERAHYA